MARLCLKKFCPDDSEFSKFAMDNFNDTFMKLSPVLDRVGKENFLLVHHSASDIIGALKRDYDGVESYCASLWRDEPAPTSRVYMDENRVVWFSQEIGVREGFIFRNGPLVLTYLEPSARVSIALGPPWEPQEEIAELRGTSFKGQFFIDESWSITGNSKKCLISGYYPYPGQPLPDGDHALSHGAIFYRKFGKHSLILLPQDGAIDIEIRKAAAIEETKQLLRRDFPNPTWEVDAFSKRSPRQLLAYLDII